MLATALAPEIGYDAAAALAKEALRSGRTIRELASERGIAADRLDELFLTVIGRLPGGEERELFTPKDDAGFEDVFWALVNSADFVFVS